MDHEIERIIPLDEVRKIDHYEGLAELSEIFQHPIIETKQGTWRWMPSRLQQYIMRPKGFKPDEAKRPFFIDLNELCTAWYENKFSIEEYMKWQMNEGYSLCGFCEIFRQRWDKETGLDLCDLVIKNHSKPENKGKNWMLVNTPWSEKPWVEEEK